MGDDLNKVSTAVESKMATRIVQSATARSVMYVLLPVAIALYLFYPLLSGTYVYGGTSEYELYKSFLVNFINTLKHFELPVWNEYIGSGHAAICLGHYPITQNTIFYILFGVDDFTYSFTKCLNFIILLLTFIYACKFFRFSYLIALLGALVYFSLNLVIRFIIADTVGNLLPLYPLLVFFIIKIITAENTKDLLLFSLFYICWLSGGHITYVFPHTIMLSVIYWITIFVFHGLNGFTLRPLRKFIGIYFVLFVLPWLAVLYQYYFVYDVILHSNRVTADGLIVSPFKSVAWKELYVSLKSSSYVWMALISLLFYACLKVYSRRNYPPKKWQTTPTAWKILTGILFLSLLILIVFKIQFVSESDFIIDYIPIVNSQVFLTALLIYLMSHLILARKDSREGIGLYDCLVFIVYVSLLSYYIYSPANIAGYDYDFFRELSVPFQIIFTFVVLYSSRNYQQNRLVKIVVLSAITVYLIRSHFTILLLRFTGIIWYSVRDGSIFSLFFAILFMVGLKKIIEDISTSFKNFSMGIQSQNRMITIAKYSILVMILILLVRDSYDKFYHGISNRLIYPNQIQLTETEKEKLFYSRRQELTVLTQDLLALNASTKHFHRIFTVDVPGWSILAGEWQRYNIYDAAIYDSSISNGIKAFYDDIILGKSHPTSKELKDALQCGVFTRHVYEGLNVKYGEVTYSDLFGLLLFPNDLKYLKEGNVEFFWDLMQVKYLIIGPYLSEALEKFVHRKNYNLVSYYPTLNMKVYEIMKQRSYSTFAILPVGKEHNYKELIQQLKSRDINVLQTQYSNLVFLDKNSKDYRLLNTRRDHATRYYEIEAPKEAVLIEFENSDHNWEVLVNNEQKPVEKVFHNLKGVKIGPGLNQVEFIYRLKYFKGLFFVSVLAILIYIILLGRSWCHEKSITKKRQ